MFKPNTQVRTWIGTREDPQYIYGTIASAIIEPNTKELLYKVEWDEGGFDYLGDYELEVCGDTATTSPIIIYDYPDKHIMRMMERSGECHEIQQCAIRRFLAGDFPSPGLFDLNAQNKHAQNKLNHKKGYGDICATYYWIDTDFGDKYEWDLHLNEDHSAITVAVFVTFGDD
jgi:hypothetical protein